MSEPDESAPIPFDPELEAKLQRDEPAIDAINDRFDRGAARMSRFEQSLRRNTEATESIAADLKENAAMTREMWEVWSAAKSGIEALAKLGRGMATIGRWIVKAAKVLAPVAAAVVATYQAFTALMGHPPAK